MSTGVLSWGKASRPWS